MTLSHTETLVDKFYASITNDPDPQAPWVAFKTLTEDLVGVKVTTFTEIDLIADLAHRAYTTDAKTYPVSGTKPVVRDYWFDIIHKERRIYVANTIEEMKEYFPDWDVIASLGCGSVINLPVWIGGALVGTFNLLHEEHHYTPERYKLIEKHLQQPAQMAFLAANRSKK